MSESAGIAASSRRIAIAGPRRRGWRLSDRGAQGAETLAGTSDDALLQSLAGATTDRGRRHAILREAMRRSHGRAPSRDDQAIAAALLAGRAAEAPPRARLASVVGLVAAHLALEGRTCHVLSSGQAASELADTLGPFLDFIGVGWGRLGPFDPAARRSERYRGPVLFATVQEVAIDLLRQRVRGGPRAPRRHRLPRADAGPPGRAAPRLLESLDFALILDGGTTLCRKSLSTVVGNAEDGEAVTAGILPEQAFGIVAQFRPDADFRLEGRHVALTRQGLERLRVLSACLGPAWQSPARAEFAVRHALEALHLWQRGTHYRVEDDAVVLDDPALRAREREAGGGLGPEPFIALKEGLGGGASEQLDRITLRTAVLQYPERAALVANLGLDARELRKAYGLRPGWIGRSRGPDAVCLDPADLSALVRGRHGRALPLIVGGSEDEAQQVGAALAEAGPRPVLDAGTEAAAVRAGLGSIGGCLWLRQPEGDTGYLTAATPGGATVVLVAIGTRWFPRVPEEIPTLRVQLADARLIGDGAPRWLRPLAWMARRALPGARHAWALGIHAHRLGENAAEARMRQRLHEFDRACMRAVSFLGPDRDWS